MEKTDYQLKACSTAADFDRAKALTNDYMIWLGLDLCFQNIEDELAHFGEMYGNPNGCFILAFVGNEVAGGVGVRKLEDDTCEMKRLFLYEQFQGIGLGKTLCETIIDKAKELGYQRMRLDTLERLATANQLYEKFGFYDIQPYNFNPDATVRYMEKIL